MMHQATGQSKNLLSRIFLAPSGNWKHWFTLALIVKGLFFLFFLSQPRPEAIKGFWGAAGGDSKTYLSPIDNLVEEGSYTPDYRMPGYGALYYPLRLVASKATASNLLILAQLLLSAFSVYLFGHIARIAFRAERLFYWAFYTYLISTYVSIFDIYLLSESLTTALLIISLHGWLKYMEKGNTVGLITAGTLFSWSSFVRQIYLPYYALYVIIMALDSRMKGFSWRKILITTTLFCLPWVVLESAWIVRNYSVHGEPNMTQGRMSEAAGNSVEVQFSWFVMSWGGSIVSWDPSSEVRWFGLSANIQKGLKLFPDTTVSLPDDIYTSAFNKDSLINVRGRYLTLKDPDSPLFNDSTLAEDVKSTMAAYTQSVKDEKPWLYHVKAPISIARKWLFHSGTYNLFSKPAGELGMLKLGIKIAYSLFYLAIIFLGFVGIIWLLLSSVRTKTPILALFPIMVLWAIAIYPIILRATEARYFVPTYPFMLLCALFVTHQLADKFLKLRKTEQ